MRADLGENMPIDGELKGFSVFLFFLFTLLMMMLNLPATTGQHQNLGVNYSNQTERYSDRQPDG